MGTITVDVTDGTLKGDVTGPTFTGSVDGAKFTGVVTYTDTTSPDYGIITNFSGTNGAQFQIDENTVKADNANKSWSLQSPDNHTLRFELHSKDCWTSLDGNWSDATQNAGAERTEISWSSQMYPSGVQITLEYLLTLLAGPVNSARWLVLTQAHATVDGPPPFGIELIEGNDRMQVKVRYRTRNQSSSTEKIVYKDTSNMQRGRSYQMKTQIRFDPAGNGALDVWRDGVKLVSYTGAIGFDGADNYFKLGCYRDPASEVQAMTFGNIYLTSQYPRQPG